MRYIFVDFEMNPLDRSYVEERQICRQELIEIGAVKLGPDFQEEDSFRLYVKPAWGELRPKIREITGITEAMLADAPGFAQAVEQFLDWSGEDSEFYAWGNSDLATLLDQTALTQNEDPRLWDIDLRWHDFQQTFMSLLGLTSCISLKNAVGSAETSFDGQQHDAMWDARNTAALFRLSQDEAGFRERMRPILQALRPELTPRSTIGDKLGSLLAGFTPDSP